MTPDLFKQVSVEVKAWFVEPCSFSNCNNFFRADAFLQRSNSITLKTQVIGRDVILEHQFLEVCFNN